MVVITNVEPILWFDLQTFVIKQEKNRNYPQILTNALNMFLESEAKDIPKEIKEGQEEANTMTQNVYKLIRTFIYYQPPLILSRMCYRWTIWTIQSVINGLFALLPYLAGDDYKNLKYSVEKLLGFLIGFFGPVIGYDYEKVREYGLNKKGKAFGIKPQDRAIGSDPDEQRMGNTTRAKFSCDLKIHQYEHAFDSFSSARRHVAGVGGDGRRMSASFATDHLHRSHNNAGHLQSGNISENNMNMANTRRLSIAPGALESMIAQKTRHVSSGSQQDNRDINSMDQSNDNELGLGDDAESHAYYSQREPGDGDSFEDDSELLSMQVETYMDAK